ncbi:MAG: ABC transporter ATP-binding protein [Bryobacteraceae bacterium]|jgi:ATP-binding cassette subfamily B protein
MNPELRAKLAKAVRQLRDVPRALRLAWNAAPRWTAASAALLAVQGLLPVATVWLSRSLVNGTVAALRSGGDWRNVRGALASAILLGAAALAGETLHSLSTWVRTNQGELVQDHILALVHRKSVEVDLAFYDSPDFFDRLHRAREEAYYRPLALMDSVANLLQNGITLAAMFFVLLSFGPWMPIALAAATLPALWVVLRFAVRQHELRVRTTGDDRRAWYYDWLLTSRETAAELRLFGLGVHFRAAFDGLRASLRSQRFRLARGNAIAELAAGTGALAASGASLGWMFWRALHGLISLGDLTLFYQAFQQSLRVVQSLLDNVGQLYYNSLFIGNLFEFLALEPQIGVPKLAADQIHPVPRAAAPTIRFDNVTFTYPGALRPVLRNLSLTIPAGRMVAFVGPNGSGKSTLVKLLCRFYDPEGGRIELDGVDLREVSPDNLRSQIAAVFQEPVRYNATAAESIALGDAGVDPAWGRIRTAAQTAGADEVIAGLPREYDTRLGKMFLEGEELSAGEWQRIAMARAFYRDARLLVLDEPTSAMDPWAEADWLDRFRGFAAARTSVVITHRLTTAMRADLIFVMSDGQVIESGSHEELVRQGGPYAQSWERQILSHA